jgi:hypothetical protein
MSSSTINCSSDTGLDGPSTNNLLISSDARFVSDDNDDTIDEEAAVEAELVVNGMV